MFGCCLVFGLTKQVMRVAGRMQRLCNTDCANVISHSGIEPARHRAWAKKARWHLHSGQSISQREISSYGQGAAVYVSQALKLA
ncbi:MAG: hypothetical protein NVS2B7_18460 [Herpetosiphon sp.]